MSDKAMLSDEQININRFAFLLLKYFNSAKIKVQDTQIKIHVNQLCGQDIKFIYGLNNECGDIIGINICKSGSGLCILLGVAYLTEIPEFLKTYTR